jgi:hypothetical protein
MMADPKFLVLHAPTPGTFPAPARLQFWVGLRTVEAGRQESGTVVVGGKHTTFAGLKAVVDQLKSELDQIICEAQAKLPP